MAAKTGQSVRTVQKATSEKPKAKPAQKKTPAGRDAVRLDRMDQLQRHINEITKLLSDSDRGDRDMIRKSFNPLLDGWFGKDGKLREPTVAGKSELPPAEFEDLRNDPQSLTTRLAIAEPGPAQPIGPVGAAITPPPPRQPSLAEWYNTEPAGPGLEMSPSKPRRRVPGDAAGRSAPRSRRSVYG